MYQVVCILLSLLSLAVGNYLADLEMSGFHPVYVRKSRLVALLVLQLLGTYVSIVWVLKVTSPTLPYALLLVTLAGYSLRRKAFPTTIDIVRIADYLVQQRCQYELLQPCELSVSTMLTRLAQDRGSDAPDLHDVVRLLTLPGIDLTEEEAVHRVNHTYLRLQHEHNLRRTCPIGVRREL